MIAVFSGLCESCDHQRIIESRRGSRFVLCELSRGDARFPRYPGLPVVSCAGYRPRSQAIRDVPDNARGASDAASSGDLMSFEE
jgi:hypothetical protein